MNSKPIVANKLYAVHTSYVVDFTLTNNIILIMGDSGTGKSVIFSILQEAASSDDRIVPISYMDKNKDIERQIRVQSGKIILVDNADVLLTDELRKYIAFDSKNQYIILGRNPQNLMTTRENLFELNTIQKDEMTIFKLKMCIRDSSGAVESR